MRNMNRYPFYTIIVVLLLSFFVQNGCRKSDLIDDNDCNCTEVFIIQNIKVIDAQGQPITDAEVRSIIEYNAVEMDVEKYHDSGTGQYCIMTDEYKNYLYQQAVWIVVGIRRPGTDWLVKNYYFNTDECKCHINLLRGELTVVFDI